MCKLVFCLVAILFPASAIGSLNPPAGYYPFDGGQCRVCSLDDWHDADAPSVLVPAPSSTTPASPRNRRARPERRATGGLGAPLICPGPGFPRAVVVAAPPSSPPLVTPTTASSPTTTSTGRRVVAPGAPAAPSRWTAEGKPAAASSHASVVGDGEEDDDGGLPQLATWKRRPQQAASRSNGNVVAYAGAGRAGCFIMPSTTCVPDWRAS